LPDEFSPTELTRRVVVVKSGIRRPPTSPIRNPGRARASSTVATRSISTTPAPNAYAAVVKARMTSITTTTPRAWCAPSTPSTIWVITRGSSAQRVVGLTR